MQQYFGKSPRKTWNRGFESLESFDGQFRRIETVQENRNFREFRVSMRSLLFTSLNRQKWFFGPAAHEVGGTKKLFYDFWLVPKGSTHTAKIF